MRLAYNVQPKETPAMKLAKACGKKSLSLLGKTFKALAQHSAGFPLWKD